MGKVWVAYLPEMEEEIIEVEAADRDAARVEVRALLVQQGREGDLDCWRAGGRKVRRVKGRMAPRSYPKTGRRDEVINLRLSGPERERIEALAHDHGLTVSSYLRMAALRHGELARSVARLVCEMEALRIELAKTT